MLDAIDLELIKLKAGEVDTGHLKLATWGTKEQLIHVLNGDYIDPYQDNDVSTKREKM